MKETEDRKKQRDLQDEWVDVRGRMCVRVWAQGSKPLLGLAVRERQGALEVRRLAESGAARA